MTCHARDIELPLLAARFFRSLSICFEIATAIPEWLLRPALADFAIGPIPLRFIFFIITECFYQRGLAQKERTRENPSWTRIWK